MDGLGQWRKKVHLTISDRERGRRQNSIMLIDEAKDER